LQLLHALGIILSALYILSHYTAIMPILQMRELFKEINKLGQGENQEKKKQF
jgi:hypothetical protein